MGALADLVIAAPTEEQEVLKSSMPDARWASHDVKGIGPCELEALAGILLPSSASVEYVPLCASHDDEGPWLFHCRGEFVHALAHVHDAHLPLIAARWWSSESLHIEEEYVYDYVVILVTAARQAMQVTKNLYLWMSL